MIANSARQQLKGFTLLELLLVLGIAAALTLLGLSQYRVYNQKRQVAVIDQNVTLLFMALNTYYREHCEDKTFSVTLSDLTFDNKPAVDKLTWTQIANPQTDYAVQANYIGDTVKTKRPIFQLQVAITLNAPTDAMNWYLNKLSATDVTGNTLKWIKLPSLTRHDISSQLWLMSSGLRHFKLYTESKNAKACAY